MVSNTALQWTLTTAHIFFSVLMLMESSLYSVLKGAIWIKFSFLTHCKNKTIYGIFPWELEKTSNFLYQTKVTHNWIWP